MKKIGFTLLTCLVLISIYNVSLPAYGSNLLNEPSLREPIILNEERSEPIEWVEICGPTNQSLASVSMVSTNDGWAVGAKGTIIRWNGTFWVNYPSPTTYDILAVEVINENDVWAGTYSEILHWDGADWSVVDTGIQYPMVNAIHARNSSDVWFAGGSAICNPVCYDFFGKIIHWNGTSWSSYTTQHKLLQSIFISSDTNGWAVGRYFLNAGVSPVITKWNGSFWSDDTHPDAYTLQDISGLSDSLAWAVGADNVSADCMTLKWDGANWVQYPCPDGFNNWLFSVDMVTENDVWAAGSGIIHWDGSEWSQVTNGFHVKSIDMLTESEGWAVGYKGEILHYGEPIYINCSYLPMIYNGEP